MALSSSMNYAPDMFSSKVAYFYREGDQRFRPVRLVINRKRYPTLPMLIIELNQRVSLTRGVRGIFSPRGRHLIEEIDDIQNEGHYICSSSSTRALTVDIDHIQIHTQPWQVVTAPNLSFTAEDSRFIRTGLPTYDASDDDVSSMLKLRSKSRIDRMQELRNLQVRRDQDQRRLKKNIPSWADRIRRILIIRNGSPDVVKHYTLAITKAYSISKVKADLSELFLSPVETIFTLSGKPMKSVEEMFETGDLAFVAGFGESFKSSPGYARVQNGNTAVRLPPINRDQLNSSPFTVPISRQRTRVITRDSHRHDDIIDFERPIVSSSAKLRSSRSISPSSASSGSVTSTHRHRKRRRGKKPMLRTEFRPTRSKVPMIESFQRDNYCRKDHSTLSRSDNETSRLGADPGQSWPNLARGDEYLLPPGALSGRAKLPGKSQSLVRGDEYLLPLAESDGHSHNNRKRHTPLPEFDMQTRHRREVQYRKDDSEWAIKLVSGTMPAGSCTSSVILTVYGHRGPSRPLTLTPHKSAFLPGASQIFYKNVSNIGDVYKIRVEITNTGTHPEWHCEEVLMKNDLTGEFLRFPCQRWFSDKQGDRQIMRELAAYTETRPPVAMCQYDVIIRTGDLWNAGTGGTVTLTIFGERGDSGSRQLNKQINQTSQQKPFVKGQTDIFQIESVSLGEIRRIKLEHEPASSTNGWFVENVTIRERNLNIDYLFPVYRWLNLQEDERSLTADVRATDIHNQMKIQDKQIWPFVRWMFMTPSAELEFYSTISRKALRISGGGFIDCRSEEIDRRNGNAVFRCEKNDAGNTENIVSLCTANRKSPSYIAFTSEQKIVSKGHYGATCDLRVHVTASREIFLESESFPCNYVSVAPNGQMYPETHVLGSPGPNQAFFCYAKGCFRNNGIIMLCTSLMQTLCIDRDPSMLTANGRRNRLAQFRCHKVANNIRMFESVIFPGCFLQMKKGVVSCEGKGDKYCEFKLRRFRDHGYVTLECARERAFVGFSPTGFVQVFFDTTATSPNCRLYPEVVEFGFKKSGGRVEQMSGRQESSEVKRRDSLTSEKHTASEPEADRMSDINDDDHDDDGDNRERHHRRQPKGSNDHRNRPGSQTERQEKPTKTPVPPPPPKKSNPASGTKVTGNNRNDNERDKVERKTTKPTTNAINKPAEKNKPTPPPPPNNNSSSKQPAKPSDKNETKPSPKQPPESSKKPAEKPQAPPAANKKPPEKPAPPPPKPAPPATNNSNKKEPPAAAADANSKSNKENNDNKAAAASNSGISKPAARPLAPTVHPAANFNAKSDSQSLEKAMRTKKADVEVIAGILTERSTPQRLEIKTAFKQSFGKELALEIGSHISGNCFNLFDALITGTLTEYSAHQLDKALGAGAGMKDTDAVIDIICTAPFGELQEIKRHYDKTFSRSLEKDIGGQKSKDEDFTQRLLAAMVQRPESPASLDAKAIKTDAKAINSSLSQPPPPPPKAKAPAKPQDKKKDTKQQNKEDESEEEKEKPSNKQFYAAMQKLLPSRGHHQLRAVFDEYKTEYKKDIGDVIKEQTNGTIQTTLLSVVEAIRHKEEYFAQRLHKVTVTDTDDAALIRLIVARCEIDLEDVKKEYQRLFKKKLEASVDEETTGDYNKALLSLIRGNAAIAASADDLQQQQHSQQHEETNKHEEEKQHQQVEVKVSPKISRTIAPTVVVFNKFNAKQDSEQLHQALTAHTVDEPLVVAIISRRCWQQRAEIVKTYQQTYSLDLAKKVEEVFADKNDAQFLSALLSLLKLPSDAAAQDLHEALREEEDKNHHEFATMGCLVQIICTSTLIELQAIKESYSKLNHASLKNDLTDERLGFMGNILASYLSRPASALPPNADVNQAKSDAKKINDDVVIHKIKNSEEVFETLFSTRSKTQIRAVFDVYKQTYKSDIEDVIKGHYSGDVQSDLLLLAEATQDEVAFSARLLSDAMGDEKTAASLISRIFISRCEIDLAAVDKEYDQLYKKQLSKDVLAKVKNKHHQDLLLHLLSGNQRPHSSDNKKQPSAPSPSSAQKSDSNKAAGAENKVKSADGNKSGKKSPEKKADSSKTAVTIKKDRENEPTIKPSLHFEVKKDTENLRKFLTTDDTEPDEVIVLAERCFLERAQIEKEYKQLYNETLEHSLTECLEGAFCALSIDLLKKPGEITSAELKTLLDSEPSSKEAEKTADTFVELICSETYEGLRVIKAQFHEMFYQDLDKQLRKSVAVTGLLRNLLLQLVTRTAAPTDQGDILAKAQEDAKALHSACSPENIKKNKPYLEKMLLDLLSSRTHTHLRAVFDYFQVDSDGKDIESAISSAFTGIDQRVLLANVSIVRNKQGYFAKRLNDELAKEQMEAISRILVNRCEVDLGLVRTEFQQLFHKSLVDAVKAKAEGNYQLTLAALINGNLIQNQTKTKGR